MSKPRYALLSASRFKQQKLPAWQPILTTETVLPWLILLGLVFIPTGVILLKISNNTKEKSIDYTTNCLTVLDNNNSSCGANLKPPCTCYVKFDLDEDIKKDVFLYYRLTNFYQNHRRYVKSRDDYQLYGDLSDKTLGDCDPFNKKYDPLRRREMPVLPCGAIANSMFNDTFKLFRLSGNERTEVQLNEKSIAWPTDKEYRYKNPSDLTAFKQFTWPKNWHSYPEDLLENEHFIVWMRTAALPHFKKLWARVEHMNEFKDSLPKGTYIMRINYNYPTIPYRGTKSFVLSNTSFIGGKNNFLGIAYIVAGSLSILISISLFFIKKYYGKRDAELMRVSSQTPFLPGINRA